MVKKIFFFINNLDFLISHREPILNAAKLQKYEIHIAAPGNKNLPSYQKLEKEGYKLYLIPFTRSNFNIFHEIKVIIKIFKLIKKVKPDICHSITLKPNLLVGLVVQIIKKSTLKKPALVIAISGLGHVFLSSGWKSKIRKYLVLKWYKFILNYKKSVVIFQNDDDANIFLQKKIVNLQQIKMIYGSGVDTNIFTPNIQKHLSLQVIFPSRVLKEKGIYEWIAAIKILKQKNIKANFILVGDIDKGNPSSVEKDQIISWVNEGLIEWWGFCSNMVEVYNKSQIVCLPSYREGLSKVLIEAASCGKPIITSDVPGCREVVENNINGLLVPAKAILPLAEAIELLINNEDLRKKMGQAGRLKAKKYFELKSVIEKTLDIYKMTFNGNTISETDSFFSNSA